MVLKRVLTKRLRRNKQPSEIELPPAPQFTKVDLATPASESFVSIPFQDIKPTLSRQTTSQTTSTFASYTNQSSPQTPSLESSPNSTKSRGSFPPSPMSMDNACFIDEDERADEMAQEILDTVKSGTHFWAL